MANAWQRYSTSEYKGLIADCLKIRERLHMCDWAYLSMLQQLGEAIFGKGTNAATLLTAYIYTQSGYQMRLARGVQNKDRIYMLFGSKYRIYRKSNRSSYYLIDGTCFYPLDCDENQLTFCPQAFQSERSMDLVLYEEPRLTFKFAPERTITSKIHPEMSFTIRENKNIIDFYDAYPSSEINNDPMTRWAMYANTPIDENTKQQIYPQMRQVLSNKTELQKVTMLLNWVQTGLVYEYDDKVWGYDRPFFAEESLYYPYADCEDRAILFSHLVRDLVGLEVLLVYYPGHMSTAVCINDPDVTGSFFTFEGKRFFSCEATCTTGCAVGRTFNNENARVILLK